MNEKQRDLLQRGEQNAATQAKRDRETHAQADQYRIFAQALLSRLSLDHGDDEDMDSDVAALFLKGDELFPIDATTTHPYTDLISLEYAQKKLTFCQEALARIRDMAPAHSAIVAHIDVLLAFLRRTS